MLTQVVIPFRDRGRDPLRAVNLTRVLDQWNDYGVSPLVLGDGRDGDAQFNRSAAYNRAVDICPEIDVFVFAESDMLIDRPQIDDAIDLAAQSPGLVVPFTEYRYLSAEDSQRVLCGLDARSVTPESVIPNRDRSWPRTGPINVVSRQTIDLVGGWDETFEGNWWDDRAMKQAFDIAAGPTRFIQGPAYHLYHLPGWTGSHLTPADRAATERNRRRYDLYQMAKTPEQIRRLTKGNRLGARGSPEFVMEPESPSR